jgi:hypothetical protein
MRWNHISQDLKWENILASVDCTNIGSVANHGLWPLGDWCSTSWRYVLQTPTQMRALTMVHSHRHFSESCTKCTQLNVRNPVNRRNKTHLIYPILLSIPHVFLESIPQIRDKLFGVCHFEVTIHGMPIQSLVGFPVQ